MLSFLNNKDLVVMNYSFIFVIREQSCFFFLFNYLVCFVYHAIKTIPKLIELYFLQDLNSSHYLMSEACITLVSTPTNEA